MKLFKNKYIDGKLVLVLAGFYTLFNLVYIGKLAYIRSFMYRGSLESWKDIIINNILFDWLVVVIYMTFIAISTKRLLDKNYSWVRIFLLHTLFSLFIGIVIRLVFDLQGIIRGSMTIADYSLKASIDRMMYVIDLNFLIYFAMIFIIYTYYYLKQIKEAEEQRSLLESQLSNTRMKMLSSQLQPHFLFNTLNSIATLVEIDAKKAQNTIADLSDFLRETLYSSDDYKVSLERELQMLKYYLNILNVRFSDHLDIHMDIDESLLRKKVPALLLQPLVENSVKHGYSYEHTHLKLCISVYKQRKLLVLKVENDGKPFKDNEIELMQKGLGIKNLKDRLNTLYGNSARLVLRNKPDGNGVETIIKIPYSQA